MKIRVLIFLLMVGAIAISGAGFRIEKAQEKPAASAPSPAPSTIAVRVNQADAALIKEALAQIDAANQQIRLALTHAKAVAIDQKQATLAELDAAQPQADREGFVWQIPRAAAKSGQPDKKP